jgi:hypothetical protein
LPPPSPVAIAYPLPAIAERISGINGQQIQRASKINEHATAFSLPKPNIVRRHSFRAKPCWKSFYGYFPASIILWAPLAALADNNTTPDTFLLLPVANRHYLHYLRKLRW